MRPHLSPGNRITLLICVAGLCTITACGPGRGFTPTASPQETPSPATAPAITSTVLPGTTPAEAPATPAVPLVSATGLIAFHSDPGGRSQLYLMNADGSGVMPLTGDIQTGAFPYWSPNGAQLAFTCCHPVSSNIYVIEADGSNPRPLTDSGMNIEPAWSPDRTQIAFGSDRDGNLEIYAMNADGSKQTNLTNSPADEGGAAWSPDGRSIAFFSDRDGDQEIYMMDADGSNPTRLTGSPGVDYTPRWSPDGQWIAFISERDGNGELYVMQPDGSTPANLSNDPAHEEFHVWSPDSTRIIYVSFRENADPHDIGIGNAEIYLVELDGSPPINLTNNPVWDGDPTWSPDGTRIAFTRRTDHGEIYVMNADGSGQTQLPGLPGIVNDCCSSWQPGE